jgi:cytochrome d ubiquinol oxidase subunit I
VVEVGLMLKYIRKGPFMDVAETDAWQPDTSNACRAAAPAPAKSQPLRSEMT